MREEVSFLILALLAVASGVLMLVAMQSSPDTYPDIGCAKDSDCVLVNNQYGMGCCYAGACERADYSLENWVAVNKGWLAKKQARYCPTIDKCGPAPLCASRPPAEDFMAACVKKICKKVPNPAAMAQATTTAAPDSYVACGCGCCSLDNPRETCLYHSKGDDLSKIMEDDAKWAGSEICNSVGCAYPIKYAYCD